MGFRAELEAEQANVWLFALFFDSSSSTLERAFCKLSRLPEEHRMHL